MTKQKQTGFGFLLAAVRHSAVAKKVAAVLPVGAGVNIAPYRPSRVVGVMYRRLVKRRLRMRELVFSNWIERLWLFYDEYGHLRVGTKAVHHPPGGPRSDALVHKVQCVREEGVLILSYT